MVVGWLFVAETSHDKDDFFLQALGVKLGFTGQAVGVNVFKPKRIVAGDFLVRVFRFHALFFRLQDGKRQPNGDGENDAA